MRYGRERGVLRWDARAWMLSERIEQVEAELATLAASTTQGESQTSAESAMQRMPRPHERQAALERLAQLTTERDDLLRQLRALGPSPRAKMG